MSKQVGVTIPRGGLQVYVRALFSVAPVEQPALAHLEEAATDTRNEEHERGHLLRFVLACDGYMVAALEVGAVGMALAELNML